MKSTVAYMSVSGNTEKVARAIAEALPGEVSLEEIGAHPGIEVGAESRAATSLDGCDLVLVGMPMHQFGAPEAVSEYLQTCCRGRRVGLFVTHAAPDDMPELATWLDSCARSAEGCDVVGVFHCQGQVPQETRQSWIATGVPMLVQFGEMAAVADGQPDEAALERAGRFAAEMAGVVRMARAATA